MVLSAAGPDNALLGCHAFPCRAYLDRASLPPMDGRLGARAP
jgi:hypothetical protein